MRKRLLTATAGVVLALLATNAQARPHQWSGDRDSDRSYASDDDDDGERQVRRERSQRRHAKQRTRTRQATKREQPRTATRRSSTRSAGGGGAGTSRGCLTPATRALLGRIEAQFGAMQIISTCRPGARIAGSGRISKHASGQAVDFNAGGRKGAVVRWLIANHKSGGTMTYSGMSHIHVDIGQHFVSLGARSRG